MTYDFTVIGGGIVGLSTAMFLGRRHPVARILVLEKEAEWAFHQTGHNSGVIHSGIYYPPGSLKAQMARAGSQSMVEFCAQHGIAHEVCGKVIVATEENELPLLENLFQRGRQNGLNITRITPREVNEIEPHVRCMAGLRVPSTGIVDYRQVALQYVASIQKQGGALRTSAQVLNLIRSQAGHILETTQGEFETRFVINCAGLHSDRVARLGRVDPQARIVPFRGEYYELKPERRFLVKSLIYPVPNPAFPFLGVHFTRMIDGSVHAGPNAVLSFKREGYRKSDFSWRDFSEVMAYPGFWKLAAKHLDEGLKEMARSFSKTAFVRSLRKLIPEIEADDLAPTQAGVRAQALRNDGRLVDNFLIIHGPQSLHVCNAPSPAATASLEIGRAIVEHIPDATK